MIQPMDIDTSNQSALRLKKKKNETFDSLFNIDDSLPPEPPKNRFKWVFKYFDNYTIYYPSIYRFS